MTRRKMPIGIQDFEDIRTTGYVYVDKTAYIYRLANEGKPYFLSRPRRFGKSLLLSTLKAYFLGKRELFEGLSCKPGLQEQPRLAIADLEKDWPVHPVFHIDLNVADYSDPAALNSALNATLTHFEEEYGRGKGEDMPPTRFLGLIRRACEKTGKKVVVLIDEYDKPLLQHIETDQFQTSLAEEIRTGLRAFYGVLKTADPWLRFVLLTGVTKFSQISVFSDLNQLMDISMDNEYAGICGISASELAAVFEEEINILARQNDMTYEEALGTMHKRYNGYHFSKNSEGVFNPFSVLNTLRSSSFEYYWYQTGTPTFLVKALKRIDFDLPRLSEGTRIFAQALKDYRLDLNNPVPLLYQSGYLTIKNYDKALDEFTLCFPNGEVEYGFLNSLAPLYIPRAADGQNFFVGEFCKNLQDGDIDGFMTRLKALLADIPYTVKGHKKSDSDAEIETKSERHYQLILYLIFRLMGQFAGVEVCSAKGRADMVVITRDTVFVFEFKLAGNGTVDDALHQIDEKGYLIPYSSGGKKPVKIGVVFDPASQNIKSWKAVSKSNII